MRPAPRPASTPGTCAARGAGSHSSTRHGPTWDIARRLHDSGAAGVLVPSVQAAGSNLVLWRWNDAPGRRVAALDPIGDLPKDQSSWRQ